MMMKLREISREIVRLRRSVCGKAVLFRPAAQRFSGGAAARFDTDVSEKQSFSANRRAKPGLKRFKRFIYFGCLLSAIALPACTPNRRIVESSRTPEPVNSAPAPTGFAADLQAMRNANFTFILVFRRKDGAVLDANDKSYLNANTSEVNRRRLSDEGRALVIGSNFPFLPGTIENLTGRFAMENYSKPSAGPLEANRAANTNASPQANK